MSTITYTPIGMIHTPFKTSKGTPIQPTSSVDTKGEIEIFPEYVKGIEDLQGFSHIFVIYHFHLSGKPHLKVTPFMDEQPRGVFSTRAPTRPNAIGLSIVRLMNIQENILYIKDVDIIDGTPLLDIKPYVPEFDVRVVSNIGWIKKNIHKLPKVRDDGRFTCDDKV